MSTYNGNNTVVYGQIGNQEGLNAEEIQILQGESIPELRSNANNGGILQGHNDSHSSCGNSVEPTTKRARMGEDDVDELEMSGQQDEADLSLIITSVIDSSWALSRGNEAREAYLKDWQLRSSQYEKELKEALVIDTIIKEKDRPNAGPITRSEREAIRSELAKLTAFTGTMKERLTQCQEGRANEAFELAKIRADRSLLIERLSQVSQTNKRLTKENRAIKSTISGGEHGRKEDNLLTAMTKMMDRIERVEKAVDINRTGQQTSPGGTSPTTKLARTVATKVQEALADTNNVHYPHILSQRGATTLGTRTADNTERRSYAKVTDTGRSSTQQVANKQTAYTRRDAEGMIKRAQRKQGTLAKGDQNIIRIAYTSNAEAKAIIKVLDTSISSGAITRGTTYETSAREIRLIAKDEEDTSKIKAHIRQKQPNWSVRDAVSTSLMPTALIGPILPNELVEASLAKKRDEGRGEKLIEAIYTSN